MPYKSEHDLYEHHLNKPPLTPIQEALRKIARSSHSENVDPNGDYNRGYLFGGAQALKILGNFLSAEREAIEQAFNAGYNNGNLDTGLKGSEYFNKTFKS